MDNNKATRVYYNCQITNQTNQSIPAKYEVNLLKPLFRDNTPDNWDLCINRFRIPLNGIPLSKNNIPFQQWQVSLGYYNSSNQWVYTNAYVPQYGSKFDSLYQFILTAENVEYGGHSLLKKVSYANNTYTVLNTLDLGVLSGNPIFVGNNNGLLVVGVVGSPTITVYNESFTILATITTPHNVVNLTIDDGTNNLYVIQSNSGVYSVVSYAFELPDNWVLANTYTSTTTPIADPRGIAFYNSNVVVSDYTNKNLVVWNASGEPSNHISNQNYLQPNAMCVNNGNLIVSYDLLSSLPTTEDILCTNTNDTLFNVSQGETQISTGTIMSACVVYNPFSQTGKKKVFGIGRGNYYTYNQPYPCTISSAWNSVSTLPLLNALATNQSNNTMYGYNNTDNGYLYTWDIHNNGTNKWYLISNDFVFYGGFIDTFESFDFMADNCIIASGADSVSLPVYYKTTIPICQRAFITFDPNKANAGMLVGINNNNLDNGFISLYSNITIENINFSTDTNTNVIQPICYDGTSFFIVNSTGGVNKYNNNYLLEATFPFTECGNAIYWLKTGSSGNIYAYELSTNGFRVYNSGGSQVLYMGVGSLLTTMCEIENVPNNKIYIALSSGNNIIYIYDITTGNPVYISAITAGYQVYGMVFNPNDTATGALYVLENQQNNQQAYGNYCERFTFTDNTYTNTNPQNVIMMWDQPFAQINYNANLDEVYFYSWYGYSITIFTTEGNLIGTVNFPSNKGFIPYQSQIISPVVNQYTSSMRLSSLCVSKLNPSILYGVGYVDNMIYSGIMSSVDLNINWTRMTQYTGASYANISTLLIQEVIPPDLPATNITTFNNSFAIQNSIDSQATSLSFISTGKNNVLNYASKTTNTIYSLQGSTISTTSYPTTGIIYGCPISAPEEISAGAYTMWSYQDYLVQINTAFTNAYNQIKTISGYAPASAPLITYSASTKLFSLVVDSHYTNMNKYVIDFNTNLYNQFLFPSIVDTNNSSYRSIVVQDFGSTATLLYIAQEDSTIAKFYDLVRILVQTVHIPVDGDLEGANTSIPLITDVVPDTSSLAPSSLLIYQPTVLRWYNLHSTTGMSIIDVFFSYGTKDGSIYPIYLSPGEYASCKLEFKTTHQVPNKF